MKVFAIPYYLFLFFNVFQAEASTYEEKIVRCSRIIFHHSSEPDKNIENIKSNLEIVNNAFNQWISGCGISLKSSNNSKCSKSSNELNNVLEKINKNPSELIQKHHFFSDISECQKKRKNRFYYLSKVFSFFNKFFLFFKKNRNSNLDNKIYMDLASNFANCLDHDEAIEKISQLQSLSQSNMIEKRAIKKEDLSDMIKFRQDSLKGMITRLPEHLEMLNFEGYPIGLENLQLLLKRFSEFKNLQTLTFSKCDITLEQAKNIFEQLAITPLPQLKTFKILENPLQDHSNTMQHISLGQLIMNAVEKMPNLTFLEFGKDFPRNKSDLKLLLQLKKKRPNLVIVGSPLMTSPYSIFFNRFW